MAKFDILANNGFNYEYVKTVEASTWKKARDHFKTEYAGDHRVADFRVRKV